MALFGGKESKEEKKAAKMQEIIKKYHLDDVNPKDYDAIKEINYGLMGTGLMDFGITLTGKTEDVAKLAYLNTLISQNWIIIRQLDEISKKLDK